MVDCELQTSIQEIRSGAGTIRWALPPPNWQAQLCSPTPIGTSKPRARGNVVHVWAASLDVDPESLANLLAVLAPDELERAERFHFTIHRNRFVAGRGLLRHLLAS